MALSQLPLENNGGFPNVQVSNSVEATDDEQANQYIMKICEQWETDDVMKCIPTKVTPKRSRNVIESDTHNLSIDMLRELSKLAT